MTNEKGGSLGRRSRRCRGGSLYSKCLNRILPLLLLYPCFPCSKKPPLPLSLHQTSILPISLIELSNPRFDWYADSTRERNQVHTSAGEIKEMET
jgi:hypothetical protein